MDTEVVAAGNLQGTKIHVKLSSEMEQKMKSLLDSEKNPPTLSPEEKTAIEELVRNIVGDYIFKMAWANGGKLYVKGRYNLLMRPDGLIQIHSADLASAGLPTIVYDGVRGNTFLKPGDIIVEPEEERWILPKLDSTVYLLMNNEKLVKRGESNEVIIGRYHGSTEDDAENTEPLMHTDGILEVGSLVRGGVLRDGNAIIPFTKMTMSEPKASASWRIAGQRRWADSREPVTYQLKLDLEYYGELIHVADRNPVVAYAGGPMRKIKLIIAFRGDDAAQQKAKFIADFRLLSDEWGTIFVLGDDMTGGGKKSTRRTKKRRTKKRRNTKRRTKKRRTKKRRNTKRRTRRR
jgi:hypothetical protein